MAVRMHESTPEGATQQLRETIQLYNLETSRQTKQLLILTWVIAVLTVVMTVGVFVQIWIAWKTLPSGQNSQPVVNSSTTPTPHA